MCPELLHFRADTVGRFAREEAADNAGSVHPTQAPAPSADDRSPSARSAPQGDRDAHTGWTTTLTPAVVGLPGMVVGLQMTAGNSAVSALLKQRSPTRPHRSPTLQRALPAAQPPTAPGSGLLPPGAATPDAVAEQLGGDYDFAQNPVDVVSGGGGPLSTGLPSALQRLEALWIKDMFTALQILRVNGSPQARTQAPYQWLVSSAASGAPRTRLALLAISNPTQIQESDYAGLPDDQVRELKAFIGLRHWDDPVAGLPRVGKPGAGALTPAQADQVEYIRRRRAATVSIAGLRPAGAGLEYDGTPSQDPHPTAAASGTLQAEVWDELGTSEGSASSVNTHDDQKLTWGRGWSALSTLPAIVDTFFAADEGARVELMEAGFTHSHGDWLFVRLSDGNVLQGAAALDEFKADVKFVSLLAHLAEDPAHRQQMVDAQWTQLSQPGQAGAVPAAIASQWPGTWTTDAVRFGAHCVHWGYSWGQVQAHGPGLPTLLAWIAGIKGSVGPAGGITVPGLATQTIRWFARGAAAALMAGPGPVTNPVPAGQYDFLVRGTPDQAWTWHH